jgi:hypothetical protein
MHIIVMISDAFWNNHGFYSYILTSESISTTASWRVHAQTSGSFVNRREAFAFLPLVVNVPFRRFLIFLTASLVNLQQLLIECGTSQLTITFHEIVDLVVFNNAFIRPSNATVGLLLPTDLQECVLSNLWYWSHFVVSSCQCFKLFLINTNNAYLLAAVPLRQDASYCPACC